MIIKGFPVRSSLALPGGFADEFFKTLFKPTAGFALNPADLVEVFPNQLKVARVAN